MTRRVASQHGQATIPLVAGSILALLGAALFAQYGGALAARGQDQRTADIAAAAAAGRMAKDYSRTLEPPVLPGGTPNPRYLSPAAYRLRAREAAVRVAVANEAIGRVERVSFGLGLSPTTVTISTSRRHDVPIAGTEKQRRVNIRAKATAELRFTFATMPGAMPANGSGGGYGGPLAYRQGKALRPNVAMAFDRLAAAARGAGISLAINSAFRSDAEQARLFSARPDPKWVAPPGTSLHRYGTEIDLGPPAAYGWLAANARRFGFIKRYAWEPWHFGFGANPRDVPAQYGAGSREVKGGSHVGADGLPSWVPSQYRQTILDAAQRFNVQPVLLAAQLKAESDFNANSVSPAGAQGIAQFVPGTARSMGLTDPFDPRASIFAQAKLMSQLIKQFESIPEGLAAYNAGPEAIQKYDGIPPYSETQAYVAKIIGLMKGAGASLDDPAFAGMGFTATVALVR
ncbi:MAG: transglycosylase SLT domain-containing protein [Solirubrobacterales bacterium]|nr:transglycosylase SLT domain-containing protein [Solirubrobacterales bacterium]